MRPKPSNSPLPSSGVFVGGGGGGVTGVIVGPGVAVGVPGVFVAVGVPGVFVTVGVPGVFVTVGVPGVFVTVGVSGVFVAVGVPGVFVAVGVPGVFVAVGVPGVLVTVGVLGVLVGPTVFVATNTLRKFKLALLLVAVGVGASTCVMCVFVDRALCVVPADGGVTVACGVGVATQGVPTPVGAVGSPGALVGCGAGV